MAAAIVGLGLKFFLQYNIMECRTKLMLYIRLSCSV